MAQKISEESPSIWTKQGEAYLTAPAIVKEVKDISGHTFEKSGWTAEVGLEVGIQLEGYENLVTLFIFGKYKRNESDQIVGHSFRSSVISFLSRILGDEAEVDDDWSLMPHVLQKCLNKEIVVLKYGKGLYTAKDDTEKINWGYWDRIQAPNKASDLAVEFQENVNNGYPREYVADTFALFSAKKQTSGEDQSTSFNYGSNVNNPDDVNTI